MPCTSGMPLHGCALTLAALAARAKEGWGWVGKAMGAAGQGWVAAGWGWGEAVQGWGVRGREARGCRRQGRQVALIGRFPDTSVQNSCAEQHAQHSHMQMAVTWAAVAMVRAGRVVATWRERGKGIGVGPHDEQVSIVRKRAACEDSSEPLVALKVRQPEMCR